MGKSENAKISFGSTTGVAPRGLYQFEKDESQGEIGILLCLN